MRTARAAAGSMLAYSLSTAALGQPVGPAIKVNSDWGPTIGYGETAVAVSSQNANEVVAAVIRYGPGSSIAYAVSVNAAGTMNRGILDRAACLSAYNSGVDVDPMAAASPTTGELWVGSLNAYQHTPGYPFFSYGFTVARRAPGSTTLDPVVGALCPPGAVYRPNDKGLLAAGPKADNTSIESLYLAWYRQSANPSPVNLVHTSAPYVSPTQPTGTLWNQPLLPINPDPGAVNGIAGNGAAPLVIPSGLNKGRIVVAFAPATFTTTPRRWIYADWSVAQQRLVWSQAGDFAQARVPGSSALHEIVGTGTADLPGPIVAANFPGIAVDPTNPLKVYVVFAGRSDPDTPNSDLYVAQSLDGGATFDPSNTLHITDAMVFDDLGTDQFMPWVAVDGYGGVNLLYYRAPTTESVNPILQARHARIVSFSAGSTTPLSVRPLSAQFFAVAPPQTLPLPGAGSIWMGDYQMNAAKGCIVWVCYVTTEEGTYNTYVRRLDVCMADIDSNGAVESADVLAFANAYEAASPAADVDGSGTVNAQDAARFMEAYNCGCGTPP